MMDWGQHIWTLATPWPKVINLSTAFPTTWESWSSNLMYFPPRYSNLLQETVNYLLIRFVFIISPNHTGCMELTSHRFGSLFSSRFLEQHLACGDMSLKGNQALNLLLSPSLSALSLSLSRCQHAPFTQSFFQKLQSFLVCLFVCLVFC